MSTVVTTVALLNSEACLKTKQQATITDVTTMTCKKSAHLSPFFKLDGIWNQYEIILTYLSKGPTDLKRLSFYILSHSLNSVSVSFKKPSNRSSHWLLKHFKQSQGVSLELHERACSTGPEHLDLLKDVQNEDHSYLPLSFIISTRVQYYLPSKAISILTCYWTCKCIASRANCNNEYLLENWKSN